MINENLVIEKNSKMKNLSGFIKKIKYSENEVILYNTLNSALVVIPNDISKLSSSDLSSMDEMGFFDTDEEANIKAVDFLTNTHIDMFSVILEMTANCNFKCSYCYQNEWDKRKEITYEILDESIEYLKNVVRKKSLTKVGLSFFGGEPLLCKDKIYYVYNKVLDFCEKNQVELIAEVTTNAYLLDSDFLSHFKQMSVLTTLSMKEDHDKKRLLCGKGKSFDKIINNLISCKDYFDSGKYSLTIRYNTDADNINEFGQFLSFLGKNNIKARKVDPAYTYEHPFNNYYNYLSFSDFKSWYSTEAVKQLVEHGFYVYKSPRPDFGPCDGYNPYSVKVFCDGRLGMCNSSVDDLTIRGNIKDISINVDELTSIFPEKKRFFIKDSHCLACKDRFLCGGEKFCRQMRICDYSEFDNEKMISTYFNYIKKDKSELFIGFNS